MSAAAGSVGPGAGADGFVPRAVAALAAGFGGIAFETAVLRRFGLVLGSTAEAAALVVALFLAGLGIGGWVAWRRAVHGRPTRAGVAYAGAAVGIGVADALTTLLGPSAYVVGIAAAAIVVGGPAIAMGLAFPRLFDGVRGRMAPGLLVATNLLGSVVAAFAAGNLLLPELGIHATFACAAGAYALAAVATRRVGATAEPADSSPPIELSRDVRLAFGAGFVAVGAELAMLRRLPFFVEGFQPTLAGVFAACLFGLALGAALGPWFAGRRVGPHAAALALIAAVFVLACGLPESVAPPLSRLAVGSEFGMHARIWLVTLAAAGPLMVALGAVVPISLTAVPERNRAAAAGLLFLAQGVGSLFGALAVNHLLAAIAPERFFVAAPLVLALVGVGCAWRVVPRGAVIATACAVGAAVFGLSGPGSLLAPRAPVVGSRYDRPGAYVPLAHRTDSVTTASVVYDRAHHSMVLFTDEFRAAYTGPGTSYMKVLGHLPFLLRDELRDVAVIALGTGTTADAVRAWDEPRAIDVVELSSAVLDLVDRFAGDGPVPTERRAPFAIDPRTRIHVTDGRRWLAERAPATLDLVTMEPLLPYAPGTANLYSAEFYALVRSRLRDAGLCVQWVPTHSMPREDFETLLATFGDAFAETTVWLVDQSTLLVGSMLPQLDEPAALARRFGAAPELALRTLQEAGLADFDDLLIAYVGAAPERGFATAVRLHDDRPFLERLGYWSGERRLGFYPENLAALATLVRDDDDFAGRVCAERRRRRLNGLAARAAAVLEASGTAIRQAVTDAAALRAELPRSTMLHAEETLALRALLVDEVRRMPPASAAPLARRHVARDIGCAELLALAGADAAPGSADARSAVERALAVDPTVALRAPWAVAWAGALVPPEPRSPLEDIGVLPDGAELAALAARRDARGFAVRAMFAVRCARACIDRARQRPLEPDELFAMREVVDPASLAAYADAVAARGGELLVEVAPAWRRELPMPQAFDTLRSGTAAERVRFATVLGDHRGPFVAAALADLLVDGDADVRRAAGVALFRAYGDVVPYDPEGPESERTRAAERVRALHNRRP